MDRPGHATHGSDSPLPVKADWEELCGHATAALLVRSGRNPQLAPRAAAAAVAAVLPPAARRWLLSELHRLGWLRSTCLLDFDVLDGPRCPPPFNGPQRELVRLAVFGLPGQGLSHRDRRRQDVYQRLCAQIMSSAVDTASLRSVAARVLSHPDVAADPVLQSMLQSFISQREAALRAARVTPDEQFRAQEHQSKLRRAFAPGPYGAAQGNEDVARTFSRLQHEFDRFLAQFEDRRAADMLERMRELRRRNPGQIAASDLQLCEEQYDRLLKRAGTYRRQIRELASRAKAAARAGDEETAHWVIRRLQAINALLPNLLPEAELDRLRAQITQSVDQHETEEVAQELTQRQQQVLNHIKDLAGSIHRFHQLADRLPHDDPAYQRAEANYRRAVAEIRGMDTEWLTGLLLHLETLLEDLDDPAGEMQNQLDAFIASVRDALNRLCLEIRAHKARRLKRPEGGGPQSEGGGPPPPPA